jgi:hypothetical protein
MCPTPTGRIHTRTATIALPALLGLIVSLLSGHPDWIALVGVYYLLGIFLDTAVYSWLLKYQPPFAAFALALSEFGLLLVLAGILNDSKGGLSHISIPEAAVFFWASWSLAAVTKIVVLPLVSLTYFESAGEFRRTEWSVPPPLEPLPVLASTSAPEVAPGQLLREASGVHSRPLEPLPSPSGVHAVPPPLGGD